MLGNMVPLSYEWFQNNWQSFSYRYMVIYDPKDEALLKAIIGDDWNDTHMRKNFYERTKADAYAQDSSAAWLAYGEAAYGYGLFGEAVSAFERGMALGSVQGVFTLRSSYPQALRALGRQTDADAMQKRLSTSATSPTISTIPRSTSFNPRARAGRDRAKPAVFTETLPFQSTRPRGARHART